MNALQTQLQMALNRLNPTEAVIALSSMSANLQQNPQLGDSHWALFENQTFPLMVKLITDWAAKKEANVILSVDFSGISMLSIWLRENCVHYEQTPNSDERVKKRWNENFQSGWVPFVIG